MPDLLLNNLIPSVVFTLIATATLTSLLTASLGAGGGIMLLAVMAQMLPPHVVIPLHGTVQLGSNAGRAAMNFRHIDRHTLVDFLPGAVIGAALSSVLLISLSPAVIYLSIALFILYICWGPALPKLFAGRWGTVIIAFLTTFLTMFVGATGPLIGAFLKQVFVERFTIVATFAALMMVQHIFKLVVFTVTGFDLWPWVPLLLAMIAGGVAGTWTGMHVLERISDRHFTRIFNWVLTLMALRLIWQAATIFLQG